jgi:Tripartite tricarboxylate transporter family receptor
MKLPRRNFLHLLAGAAALPALSRVARAQAYPSRPVRIFVGFPASATPDIVARLVGQPLSERLVQPVVIENRPGAAGNIATEAVVRATPDGYTLLLTNGANAVSAALYEKLSFDFIRDVVPVASIGGLASKESRRIRPSRRGLRSSSYYPLQCSSLSLPAGLLAPTHWSDELIAIASRASFA